MIKNHQNSQAAKLKKEPHISEIRKKYDNIGSISWILLFCVGQIDVMTFFHAATLGMENNSFLVVVMRNRLPKMILCQFLYTTAENIIEDE